MQNSSIHSEAIDNGPYQRRMVKLLLETMTPGEAVQYCLENGWEGVLESILHATSLAHRRR